MEGKETEGDVKTISERLKRQRQLSSELRHKIEELCGERQRQEEEIHQLRVQTQQQQQLVERLASENHQQQLLIQRLELQAGETLQEQQRQANQEQTHILTAQAETHPDAETLDTIHWSIFSKRQELKRLQHERKHRAGSWQLGLDQLLSAGLLFLDQSNNVTLRLKQMNQETQTAFARLQQQVQRSQRDALQQRQHIQHVKEKLSSTLSFF